ncbi:MAG: sn-glycerol-1-phosphate dehydrogenase [Oscillospiraceae bacterium]|nr:sn-glycerol-1-phosphate dehydrogenase [Oscillospiraceae bacterium]
MDIKEILYSFEKCRCGRKHDISAPVIICGSGISGDTGCIIAEHTLFKKILLVADKNTISVSEEAVFSLCVSGFVVQKYIYDNLRVADIGEVEKIESICGDSDIILSIGTGSLNDICRLAAFRQNKYFIIFATAPSMDGFASDTAPITCHGFKLSYQAKQPELIIADTRILSASPAVLKGAGFGDMIAKYIAVADWRISNLLTNEYLCPDILNLTKTAADKIASLAPVIQNVDEAASGEVLNALIMTGVAMKLSGNSRPASGAEHIISHFWESKKLDAGEISDFHGRKVAVGTLLTAKAYYSLLKIDKIKPKKENIECNMLKKVYGERLYPDVEKMNFPDSINIVSNFDLDGFASKWDYIKNIIRDSIPEPAEIEKMLITAGAPTRPDQIGVSDELCIQGLRYHMYMRKRITLMRLMPLIGADPALLSGVL